MVQHHLCRWDLKKNPNKQKIKNLKTHLHAESVAGHLNRHFIQETFSLRNALSFILVYILLVVFVVSVMIHVLDVHATHVKYPIGVSSFMLL